MTEFALHTAETAPGGSQEQLATTAKTWGFVPKLHAILAESPVALIGYETLYRLVARSTLTPAEQQVTYLTISVFHGCEYCTMGHKYLAREAKLEEAEIQRLTAGNLPVEARLAALSRFTRAVVNQRGQVGDSAVDEFLAAGFTKANVLEVVTIIATKTISNYVDHIAHTPKEDFMSDPSIAWAVPARSNAT